MPRERRDYPRPNRSDPALRPMTEKERTARPRLMQLDSFKSVALTAARARVWALRRGLTRGGRRSESFYPTLGEAGTDDDS